ncbi:MAG: NifB/NifX family molybdenum-iron cluster-binding protein [Anaerolineae bacterium]|nr:NifB/NifX family molybdenum-iron cluster-binding protein [Anaerolineae bacterium]
MKIAAITDDGKTISAHFGRASYYLVSTVEDTKVVHTELRDKVGHRQFASQPHDEETDPRGHGFGAGSEARHASMIAAIADCEALLVRGMGRGAHIALQEANIRPVVTDIESIEAAVQAFLRGDIVDHIEWLH